MREISHITDCDLERYCLGMVHAQPELAGLEEHLLWCDDCLDRLFVMELHINTIRRFRRLTTANGFDVSSIV